MRLIERGADDFIIESETGREPNNNAVDRYYHYDRTAAFYTNLMKDYKFTAGKHVFQKNAFEYQNSKGLMIAPCAGGWIKIENYVPVISRSDVVYNMPQGLKMNVRLPENEEPVANEFVAAGATVIGNDGSVTILNAAGKKIVISNVLGQTVANAVLNSDNATIAAPKGVVVVAIEGQTAVKALVK
jgi:hypothetical protein